MNNNFLKVSKKWYDKKYSQPLINTYGDVGFGFYIYSLHNRFIFNTGSFVSVANFLDQFKYTNKTTRRNKKKELLNVIEKMEVDGLITFYKNTTFNDVIKFDSGVKDTDIQYCIVREDDTDLFAKVYYKEYNSILQSNNPLQLLIHFTMLAGFINNDTKIAYPQIATLASYTNTSSNTCIKNNNILQDMKLIYFDNAGVSWGADGFCKSHNNTYSRYHQRQFVFDYIDKVSRDGDIAKVVKGRREIGDTSRSLSNQITKLIEKETLTTQEKQRLYDLAIEYINVRGKIDNGYEVESGYAIDTPVLTKVKKILQEIDMTDVVVNEVNVAEEVIIPVDAKQMVVEDVVSVPLTNNIEVDHSWIDDLEDQEIHIEETKVKNDNLKDWKDSESEAYMEIFGSDDKEWSELFGE